MGEMMYRCSGNPLSRRNLLTIGAIGGLGLTLTDFFRLRSAQAEQKVYRSKPGTAKSVIFIFLPGGIAHQDSFDPKPFAPLEYRGPFGTIETALRGVRFSELFPDTAKIADRLTIIRSMTHGEAAHERGVHNMFTGSRPSPALQFPSIGSVVAHEFGPRKNLPPYVMIPNQPNTFAGSGYLSSSFSGFSLGADPAQAGFKVRDLQLPAGVSKNRFSRRQKLLDVVNDHFRSREKSDALDAVDSFYNRAYDLISSQQAREAFDIEKEPAKLRDRYGRNQAGARMLLARRLVESGVRFVTMTYGGWDHHDQVEKKMRGAVPNFDKAYATLISDLENRGLLESTLVVVTSEFGRSPKINATAGRDHWAKVFSTLMAGGGIKAGQVYGSSDATASEPADHPVSVEDWATTIYACLGINADKELMAPGNRPVEIVDGGRVRKDLLV
jgi:hypothetical protein